ncbi:MAG: hypothetical protein SO072_01380 [Dysosmobacter sp.]|nr:hypothetical protein [Dysosmobacter sp.]
MFMIIQALGGILIGYFGVYCIKKGAGHIKPIGCGVIGLAMMIIPGGDPVWRIMLGLAFILISVVWGIIYFQNEKNGKNEKKRVAEQEQINQEYRQAVASQQTGEPWKVRYATTPCPHCGHYKVRCAKWEDKRWSVAFWGAASDKIGKSYKCEHCGEMW